MSDNKDIPRATTTGYIDINHLQYLSIPEVIEQLQELDKRYGGGELYISTEWDYEENRDKGDLSFCYRRPETDDEYNHRVALTLRARNRDAEFAALDKMVEEQYAQEQKRQEYQTYLDLKAKFEG